MSAEASETFREEVRHLLEAVHRTYGYDFREYSISSMGRRLMAALGRSTLRSLNELERKIVREPVFFASVLEDLTIGVTSFFRDPSFYRAVREHVVPVLRTYPAVRIWMSGCSTGEEVYSTAILLMEEGLYERCQIFATDLRPGVLERAKQAVYAAEHLEQAVGNYERGGGTSKFSDYFDAAYDHFTMRSSVRRNIHFFEHDLVCDHVFGEMQVVFCRNVMIYFSGPLKKLVTKKLWQSVCPGGFLCLGTSEQSEPFEQGGALKLVTPQERIYQHVLS